MEGSVKVQNGLGLEGFRLNEGFSDNIIHISLVTIIPCIRLFDALDAVRNKTRLHTDF